MFEVQWTGKYPCLCHGEWIIKKDGVVQALSEAVKTSPMFTYGTYHKWHFGKNWDVIDEDYENGLDFSDWLSINTWVLNIAKLPSEQIELFEKIQEQDFRSGSCGGCI